MFKKILVSIVLGITALAQVADAAVIYSQASAAGTTSINSQEAIGGSDYDVFAFAAFTPTQSGTIDNISWQGTSNNSFAYAGFSDGFSIDVLDGQFALPGTTQYAPVSHTTIATTSLANPTLAANGMYDYNTDVKPFNVQAGVTYRISIRSNGIAPWGWASVPGTGTIAYYKGLASVRNVSGIPVFSLNNVHNSSVAPAPTNPTNVTILPVPAPTPTTVAGEIGQVQGMITAVGNKYVIIDNIVVTHDGDTVKKFNGGLKVLAVGEMVNYTYIVDVDGVIIAKTMDIYPAEAITGVDRVNRIDVTNSTAVVALTLYRGPVVDFYQNSGIFVTGAGTNTSYGAQLVNYTGFINPTTGHIVASVSGYMSNIPVTFYPVLPAATVGKAYNQYAIDISAYGAANIFSVGATGLPPGMTNNMGVISGTPTTPGTYTVNLTAIGGQYNVSAYTQIGNGNVTIVVYPDTTVTPPPAPDTTAPVITMNGTDATLTVGDVYTDAGVTCTDNTDTTCTVTTTNTVSTATAGTYTVTYTATDAAGNISTATRTVTVNPAPVVSVGTTLANAKVGVAYPATSLASPSVSLYMISNTPVTGIPPGMTVSVTGLLSGTPTVAGTYQIGFYAIGTGLRLLGDAVTTIVVDPATVVVPPTPVVPPADTTAPVITLNGGDVVLTVGDVYADAGATAIDAIDGTVTVTSTNNVDTTVAGTYTVTYSATDAAGNISTATRTVTVNPAPVVIVPCSGVDQVITNATNVRGGIVEIGGGPSNGGTAVQIFQNTTTIVSPLTTSTFFAVGNLITFSGVMSNGVCVTTSATISPVPDTTAPVITLNGGDVVLTVGDVYADAGATAIDAIDGTVTVTSTNNVDTTVAGTYTVTYSATDAAGNISTATRTVTVNPAPDTTAPVITVNGGNATLTVGTTYTDAGATCKDNKDTTCTVITTNTVNVSVAGTYTVTYKATDAAGNISTATRTVTVNPASTGGIVSTGKSAEGNGKITAITPTTITIGTTLVRITPTTLVKLNNNKPLKVGDKVEYKGTKNTDGSVTATSVKIQ